MAGPDLVSPANSTGNQGRGIHGWLRDVTDNDAGVLRSDYSHGLACAVFAHDRTGVADTLTEAIADIDAELAHRAASDARTGNRPDRLTSDHSQESARGDIAGMAR